MSLVLVWPSLVFLSFVIWLVPDLLGICSGICWPLLCRSPHTHTHSHTRTSGTGNIRLLCPETYWKINMFWITRPWIWSDRLLGWCCCSVFCEIQKRDKETPPSDSTLWAHTCVCVCRMEGHMSADRRILLCVSVCVFVCVKAPPPHWGKLFVCWRLEEGK